MSDPSEFPVKWLAAYRFLSDSAALDTLLDVNQVHTSALLISTSYPGTPEKDSRPIRAEFVRLLRVNQAGKRSDIKWARSQKAGLQMTAGALIADQAIRKL